MASMKEHETFPGKPYVVTCKAGCDITDASGELDETCEPGKQKVVYAPSEKLFTSENAVVRETFNRAALALGLLGGGVKNELPAGYLRAEFLESTGTQYVDTKLIPNDTMGVSLLATQTGGMNTDMYLCGVYENSGRFYPWLLNGVGKGAFFVGWNSGTQGTGYFYNTKTQVQLNYKNNRKFVAESNESRYELTLTQALQAFTLTMPLFCARNTGGYIEYFVGKLYAGSMTEGAKKIAEFVPTVTNYGVPCLLDTITQQTFYNLGTGQFIAGFTLQQARKLGAHLPAGGGSLTISLPTGYEQDGGVMDALETARANGWTLTMQTYAAEAGASTFALRRIWVRKTASEHGGYVDADGVRYSVEWCVAMLTPDGSTPDAHGYEPFRSVEAATEYWELTPYVDPEAENELNTI